MSEKIKNIFYSLLVVSLVIGIISGQNPPEYAINPESIEEFRESLINDDYGGISSIDAPLSAEDSPIDVFFNLSEILP